MPFESEKLAEKFGESAGDIQRNLDGLIEKAEDADKAFAKMIERQEDAVKIQNKFAVAIAASKSLATFGRSGVTAARGLKTVDNATRMTASSLGSLGAGAVSAVAGFRALSAETVSFSSDITTTNRSIAGLVTEIGGLESKLKTISTSSVAVNLVVGSLKDLDDLEQRLNALSKNVAVNLSAGGKGAGAVAGVGGTGQAASGKAAAAAGKAAGHKMNKAMYLALKAKQNPGSSSSVATTAMLGNTALTKKKGAQRGLEAAKAFAKSYSSILEKELSSAVSTSRTELANLQDDFEKTGAGGGQIIELSMKISGQEKVKELLDNMEYGTEKAQSAWEKFHQTMMNNSGDMIQATKELRGEFPELGDEIDKAMNRAKEAAEGLTSQMRKLEIEANKQAKTLGDLGKKKMAEFGLEAGRFAEGLGASATGMLAVGVAAAYLAKKMGELVDKFMDSALGLARYRVELAAANKTIVGFNKGALENMRKQLSLTRSEAAAFFEVVRKGVNELGMSQEKIMGISKALQATFGGDQTDRLRKYVDLLETIPTIETDLNITANLDDRSAAIFGLAKTGKMDIVMDLQTAGLLGGVQKTEPTANLLNVNQRTAAAVEGIHDWLVRTLFPTLGPALSAGVKEATNIAEGVFTLVGLFGAMRFLFGATKLGKIGPMLGGITRALQGLVTNVMPKIGAKTASSASAKTLAASMASSVEGPAGGAASAASAGVAGTAQTAVRSGLTVLGKSAAKAAPALGKVTGMLLKLVKGGGIAIATGLVEMGLGKFADDVEKTGHDVKAAGIRLGKSAAAIAGYAATGFMFGGAVGAVVGALAGLAVESNQIVKSIKTIWEGTSDVTNGLGKAVAEYDSVFSEEQEKFVKSGMALQRGMKKIEAAFGSAKFKLLEMNKALAGMELDNITKIGGSAGQFNSTIKSISGTVRKQYDEMRKTVDKERKRIDSDGTLMADDRKNQLSLLHEQEMRAVQSFVAGIGEVVDALFQSPEIIQSGLKAQIAKRKYDFAVEAGALPQKEMAVRSAEITEQLTRKLNETFNAGNKAAEEAAKMSEELAKDRIAAEKALKDQILQIDAEIAKGNLDEAKKREKVQMSKTLKSVVKEGKIDTGAAESAMSQAEANADAINKEVEDKRESLMKKFNMSAASQAADVQKQFEVAQNALREATSKLETQKSKGTINPKKLREASEEVNAAQKSYDDVSEKRTESIKKIAEQLMATSKSLNQAKADEIVNKMMEAKGGIEDWVKIWSEIPGLNQKVKDKISESAGLMKEIAELEKKKGKEYAAQEAMRRFVGIQNEVTALLQLEKKTVEEQVTAAGELADHLDQVWKQFGREITNQERAIKSQQQLVALSGMMGNAIEERAKLQDQESAVAVDQYKSYMQDRDIRKNLIDEAKKSLGQMQNGAKADEDRVKELEKGTDAEKELAAIIKSAKGIGVFESYIAKLEGQVANIDAAASDVLSKLPQIGENVTDNLRAFESNLEGVGLQKLDDLAAALADSAEYAGDLGALSTESFEIGKKAAMARLDAEKEIIRKSDEEAKKDIARRAAMKGGDEGARYKAAAEAVQADVNRLELAKAETKQKRTVVNLAKQSSELKMREVNTQQELIDDAMSFASEFGGSFASIQALQQLDVGLARDKLDIAIMERDRIKQGFEAAAAAGQAAAEGSEEQLRNSQALFDAQKNVALATLGVRRKELGIQKDLMSRLLGGVFGELNANIGARRGVGSDVALMGMDKTRMKNAAGMFVNVPGGKPGTIAERALKRQMGGGAGGPLAEMEKAGGPMAEVAKALGKAPTKEQQDKLFGAMTSTEKNTKDSANSLGLGDHPGSFFTHDTTAEGLLGGILGVLREIAIKTLEEDQIKTSKGKTGKEDVTTKLDKIITESSKAATTNAENTSRSTAGLVTDVVQKNVEKVAESAGKLKMEVAAPTKASTANEANKAYAAAYQKYGADSKETEDARKAFEQASSTPMTAKGGTKADDTNKFWAQKKPTAIGGFKAETDGLGGTDPRWANRIKIGESPARLKKMERLEMSSGLAERHKAAFGGAGKPGGTKAGGVQTVGGFGGKGGVSSTISGSDTMTGRAAGMSVAPPMSGDAVAKAPGGAGAETGETGSGMKVSGEMLVRFDNKMFKDTLTPVVLQIIDTNKRRWQQMFMTGAGA